MIIASPLAAQRVKNPKMSATAPSSSTIERNLSKFATPADMPSGTLDQKINLA